MTNQALIKYCKHCGKPVRKCKDYPDYVHVENNSHYCGDNSLQVAETADPPQQRFVTKNKSTPENREFWEHVERISKEARDLSSDSSALQQPVITVSHGAPPAASPVPWENKPPETTRPIHKTVPVKVWADIDTELVQVVLYLNTIPGIRTEASCQGTIGEGGPAPYRAQVMATWTEEAHKRLQDQFDFEPLGLGWGYIRPKNGADKFPPIGLGYTELEWTDEEIKSFSEATGKMFAAPSPKLIGLMSGKAGTQMEEKRKAERRKNWEWKTGKVSTAAYITESGDKMLHAERRKSDRRRMEERKPDVENEIEFAEGNTIETQGIRVTYSNLSKFIDPQAKFPNIYKRSGNNSVSQISLTPEEGRYLAKVLTEMFSLIKDKYTLNLEGKATDNIWLMEDGDADAPIGMRLDSGDSGVVYLSKSQAKDLSEQLAEATSESTNVMYDTQNTKYAERKKLYRLDTLDRIYCWEHDHLYPCPMCGSVMGERKPKPAPIGFDPNELPKRKSPPVVSETVNREPQAKPQPVGYIGAIPVYSDPAVTTGGIYFAPDMDATLGLAVTSCLWCGQQKQRGVQHPPSGQYICVDCVEQINRGVRAESEVQRLRAQQLEIAIALGYNEDILKNDHCNALAESAAELKQNAARFFDEAASLRAFSLLQSECISAADSMYGACLSGDPDDPQVQTELIQKFKTTFEAAAKHKFADEFLTISELKDEAASLRGLVGRMLPFCKALRRLTFSLGAWKNVVGDLKHFDTVISEAEAAIKQKNSVASESRSETPELTVSRAENSKVPHDGRFESGLQNESKSAGAVTFVNPSSVGRIGEEPNPGVSVEAIGHFHDTSGAPAHGKWANYPVALCSICHPTDARRQEEVCADIIMGLYCNGRMEEIPMPNDWSKWQRIADYMNQYIARIIDLVKVKARSEMQGIVTEIETSRAKIEQYNSWVRFWKGRAEKAEQLLKIEEQALSAIVEISKKPDIYSNDPKSTLAKCIELAKDALNQ